MADQKIDFDYINFQTHTSNGGNCDQLNVCRKILQQNFNLNMKYLDNKKDKCFCVTCRANRHNGVKKGLVFQRGGGVYIIPEGWSRICLLIDRDFVNKKKVLQSWHPSYHGTRPDNVPKIINGGLKFLVPGDTRPDGTIHGIRKDCGRIRTKFQRYNQYYKCNELFDPDAIFSSPSMKYATFYAPDYVCKHPNDSSKNIKVKFVFALRQKASSFKIGQETMGYNNTKISKFVPNDRIEYYTTQNDNNHFLVNGLLMKYQVN